MSRTKVLLGVAVVVGWVALSLTLLFVVAERGEVPDSSVTGRYAPVHEAEEDTTSVPCPTEDSCTVDYRDGAWHITEVQP